MKNKLIMSTSILTLTGMLAMSSAQAANIQVAKGDTLYSIAKKYNVSVDTLQKENKLANTTIYVGQTLSIPSTGGGATTPSTPSAPTTTQKQVSVAANDVLNVRSGPGVSYGVIGTLKHQTIVNVYSISGDWAKVDYGTKTGYVNANYLKNVTTSSPTPPPVVETPSAPPTTTSTYTVEKGDTLYKIGVKFNVSYQEIKKWNNLTTDTIKVGQVLKIAADSSSNTTPTPPTSPAPPTSTQQTYVVKAGDTLYKIAKETGVSVTTIQLANNLTNDTIKPGQVLKINASANARVFANPAEGVLTSGYGMRWGSMHYGIDIAKTGIVPIRAAYDGVVTRAKSHYSWGNYVMIQHEINGTTYYTLYAHMRDNSLQVKVGDRVKVGQQIGLMGTTGNSTGQHLHLELYIGGDTYGVHNVNPIHYFAY